MLAKVHFVRVSSVCMYSFVSLAGDCLTIILLFLLWFLVHAYFLHNNVLKPGINQGLPQVFCFYPPKYFSHSTLDASLLTLSTRVLTLFSSIYLLSPRRPDNCTLLVDIIDKSFGCTRRYGRGSFVFISPLTFHCRGSAGGEEEEGRGRPQEGRGPKTPRGDLPGQEG